MDATKDRQDSNPAKRQKGASSRRRFLKRAAGFFAGAFVGAGTLAGCDSFLTPEVHSQLAPQNFLPTEEGALATLGAAYAEAKFNGKAYINNVSDWPSDIAWQTGGGENRAAVPIINFTWDDTFGGFHYNNNFQAVRNANIILDNIDELEVSEDKRDLFRAEARFVRAEAYINMYRLFGPVPLRTSTNQELELPRASEEEMQSFIEEELRAAIVDLPAPGQEPAYGRATNGAARGRLAKFFLNTKQWQKAADMAQEVIDMNAYGLYPNHLDMFKVQNERNEEMVWVWPSVSDNPATSMNYMNAAFPPGFKEHPRTGLTWQPNWNNWASQYRLRDQFVNSFEEGDERQEAIIKEYVNFRGDLIDLRGHNNTRSFKTWPDPNAQGNFHGNDHPVVRYADILLTRAEALNELNGPNQESIDLINQVRARAGLDGLTVAEFGSREELRDHLLLERAWEFHTEGQRRVDLIRMGKFIEGTVGDYKVGARDRGIDNAQPHHRRFPIPRVAMDSNPALEQNPGY